VTAQTTGGRARRVVRVRPPADTTPTTAAEAKADDTPPPAHTKHIGTCPVCDTPGKLTVEPRHDLPGHWWVNCWTCPSDGYLRAVAEVVGAPGGGHIKANAPAYLDGYLDSQTRTNRAPEPLPSFASIDGAVSRLFSEREPSYYLLHTRRLTEATICERGIGWDGSAFTFPIYDAQGELVNVVRRPWPNAEPGRKYISLSGRTRQNGGIQLYPDMPPDGPILLCEGLLDALLVRQYGLGAVTSSQGVNTFLDEWLPLFEGRRVAVCFDVGAEKVMVARVRALSAAGAAEAWPVRIGRLLPKGGKDLSDYLTGSGTRQELLELIHRERRRWRP
jgi:hypothetical protein